MNAIRSFIVRLLADALDHNMDWRLDAMEQTIQTIDSTLSAVDDRLDAIDDTLRDMDRTLDAIHSDMPTDDDVDACDACDTAMVGDHCPRCNDDDGLPPDSDGPMLWRDNEGAES